MARQESMMREVKDCMLTGNEEFLNKEKDRGDRELAIIESSLKQMYVSIRNEVNEESKWNLVQLLEEMQEQKASNDLFRNTCQEALLKTKNIHNEIEQKIKNTQVDDISKAVARLINTDGEVRNIKQDISDTSARGGSFAGAGIIHGLDLSILNSRNK